MSQTIDNSFMRLFAPARDASLAGEASAEHALLGNKPQGGTKAFYELLMQSSTPPGKDLSAVREVLQQRGELTGDVKSFMAQLEQGVKDDIKGGGPKEQLSSELKSILTDLDSSDVVVPKRVKVVHGQQNNPIVAKQNHLESEILLQGPRQHESDQKPLLQPPILAAALGEKVLSKGQKKQSHIVPSKAIEEGNHPEAGIKNILAKHPIKRDNIQNKSLSQDIPFVRKVSEENQNQLKLENTPHSSQSLEKNQKLLKSTFGESEGEKLTKLAKHDTNSKFAESSLDELNSIFEQGRDKVGLMTPAFAGRDALATEPHHAKALIDISAMSTSDSEKLMDQISKHIEQGRLNGQESLDLNIKHDDFGIVGLKVEKFNKAGDINIHFSTNTEEARRFFTTNQDRLMGKLQQAGFNISDFRVDFKQSISESSFAQSDSMSQERHSQEHHQQSFQQRNGEQKDSQRRREIWQMYQQFREAA